MKKKPGRGHKVNAITDDEFWAVLVSSEEKKNHHRSKRSLSFRFETVKVPEKKKKKIFRGLKERTPKILPTITPPVGSSKKTEFGDV